MSRKQCLSCKGEQSTYSFIEQEIRDVFEATPDEDTIEAVRRGRSDLIDAVNLAAATNSCLQLTSVALKRADTKISELMVELNSAKLRISELIDQADLESRTSGK